jgi:hypothetical protein
MRTFQVEVPIVCTRLFTVEADNIHDAKSQVYLRQVNAWAVVDVTESDREKWVVREIEGEKG